MTDKKNKEQGGEHNQWKIAKLLGLGLDCDDGHTRVTIGENFLVWGGKQETHEFLRETVIKVNETLNRRGKRLEEVSVRELRDICREVVDKIGYKPEQ